MTAMWSCLARYQSARLVWGGQGATFVQHSLYRRFRSMIPQLQRLQRTAHVQAGQAAVAGRERWLAAPAPSNQSRTLRAAGAAPIAEEEGQALSALHHHGAPASTAPQQQGFIEIICGPMFAGKSTELIRRVELQQQRGMNVAVVKSNKDNRYDLSHVVTHDGLKRPCYSVPSLAMFRHVAGPDYHSFQVIAIDEAQFFGDLAEFCAAAADHEAKHLIVAGLDGDFQRRRFGQILDLVPFADTVTKLTAQCTFCQHEAQAAVAAAAATTTNHSSSNGNCSSGLNGTAVSAVNGACMRRPMGSANHAPAVVANGMAAAMAAKHATAGAGGKQAQHVHQQAGAPAGAVGAGPRPALFSLRIAADSRQEVVGGADKYAPVCRHHYLALSQVRQAGSQLSREEEATAAAAGEQP